MHTDIEKVTKFIDVIPVFSSKERAVVKYRHGLTDGVTHTLEETGKLFGVTRERIRQIEAKVMYKIEQYERGTEEIANGTAT